MPPDGRDLELIACVNRGDGAAFAQLYERYRDRVLRLAMRRLGNPDEALDVMQDTFLKLYERFPGFELTTAMTTYLSVVAERLCRDRRDRRRATVDIDDIDDAHESVQSLPDVSGDAAGLLARLTPEQRKLLALRYGHDLSHAQLAARFDLPVGTIKSRLHYAMAALREKVDTPLGRKS